MLWAQWMLSSVPWAGEAAACAAPSSYKLTTPT